MITQERLKHLISFDPESGIFRWIRPTHPRIKKNSIAGCKHNKTGYILIYIDGKQYYAHRLVFLYLKGSVPKDQVDHINGIYSDNRYENLRPATNQENGMNRKIGSNNKNGILGVYWIKSRQKFLAGIKVDGKQRTIGWFGNLFDACCARKSAENNLGFHFNHGRR